jgi:hypothetical protein
MDAQTSWVHLVVNIALDWRFLTSVAVLVRLLRKR